MKKSKKASARVTDASRTAASADAESRSATRGKAVRAGALESAARRQLQKTESTAVRGHVQARGQRRQAKRDAR
jgi:hypothetical protein